MQELIARALMAIHRLIDGRPLIHQQLIRLVNRSVGEKRVNTAILALTHSGDVVWDVGANVGVYTRLCLDRVGSDGHVVAVDPVPSNAARLRELGPSERLTVIEAALATFDGQMPLVVSGKNGETSSLGNGPDAVTVRVARGDTLLAAGVLQPQIVKIDVEGFEGDVLDGMPDALAGVRSLIIEVHFAALGRRGRPRDPLRLLKLLTADGFSVRWIDSSHLVATR
jgi:FkbM family methyltransferase